MRRAQCRWKVRNAGRFVLVHGVSALGLECLHTGVGEDAGVPRSCQRVACG